jgi:hypothetical protein
MDRQRRAATAALAAMDGLRGDLWPTAGGVGRRGSGPPPAVVTATLRPCPSGGPGSIWSMMSMMSIPETPSRSKCHPWFGVHPGPPVHLVHDVHDVHRRAFAGRGRNCTRCYNGRWGAPPRTMDIRQWTSWTSWTGGGALKTWTAAPRCYRSAGCHGRAAGGPLADGRRCWAKGQWPTAGRGNCHPSSLSIRGPRVHLVHDVHNVHPPKPPAVASATLGSVSIRGPRSILSMMSIAGPSPAAVGTAPAVTTAGGARPQGRWTSDNGHHGHHGQVGARLRHGPAAPRRFAPLAAMDWLQWPTAGRGNCHPSSLSIRGPGSIVSIMSIVSIPETPCRSKCHPWFGVHPGPRVHRVHNVHRVHPRNPMP